MAEEPEDVLPKDRTAACSSVEEIGTESSVKENLDQPDSYYGHGGYQEERGDQGHPDEWGHPHERHAGCAHVNYGHGKVKGTGKGRDSKGEKTETVKGHSLSRGKGFFSKVGVCEPAGIRGAESGDETAIQQQTTEEEDPVAEGVEPWEGNVSGANGERNDNVEESDTHGHDAEEDHREGVHGEHLVESAGVNQGAIGPGELGSDDERFYTGAKEEDYGGNEVEDADTFVIDGSDPTPSGIKGLGPGRCALYYLVNSYQNEASSGSGIKLY